MTEANLPRLRPESRLSVDQEFDWSASPKRADVGVIGVVGVVGVARIVSILLAVAYISTCALIVGPWLGLLLVGVSVSLGSTVGVLRRRAGFGRLSYAVLLPGLAFGLAATGTGVGLALTPDFRFGPPPVTELAGAIAVMPERAAP